MKQFFNIDLHISVIADIKDIFKRIDKNINITDWSLSGHSWVFNKNQKKLEIINGRTWINMNTEVIDKFIEKYDDIFKTFDAFICCHPNSFVLFFEKYNKPIYIINSCRYDLPFCWTNNHDMINKLNNCFTRLQNKSLLTFISNNKADNAYFKLANPTIETKMLPSLCLYTKMTWNPLNTCDKFLLYSGNIDINHNVIHRSKLGKYNWNVLMRFKGIIHFPYEASTMSIFEQISSEIPLFFPSKKFLKYLWENKIIHHQMNYWKHYKNCSSPECLKQTENLDFWINKADYYDLKGYYYFDSFENLKQLLDNFTDSEYITRKQFIKERKENTIDSYKTILTNH